MSDLIDTTEMYLRTIFELEEEGVVALRARIAERLGHSGPTVSQTVARMERDGLVHVSSDRHLELTDAGRERAVRVMRKHRLAERLLLDVIGLEWAFVHDEACRWEHVMSERVERKLVALLGDPAESPYGNPIPGLGELTDGEHMEPDGASELRALTDELVARDGARGGAPRAFEEVVVRRLAETVQTDTALLGRLAEAGVVPGAKILACLDGATVRVESGDSSADFPLSVAAHVFVVRGA